MARPPRACGRCGPGARPRRTAPATSSGDRPPRDPRPRRRHRVDGPLARATAARTAALGRARPGRRPAGPRRRDRPGEAADGAAVTVETRQSDITRLEPGDLADATLITASAILDLLTGEELAGLVAVCAGTGCPVLLTLSVVGRVDLNPADPLDASVAAAFDAHQRRTTEEGRLLGPDAVAFAVEGFSRLEAEVLVRPSPWRLGAVGGRPGDGVVHRVDRRRVRAAGRAGRRGRRLRAPTSGGGNSRTAQQSPWSTPTC